MSNAYQMLAKYDNGSYTYIHDWIKCADYISGVCGWGTADKHPASSLYTVQENKYNNPYYAIKVYCNALLNGSVAMSVNSEVTHTPTPFENSWVTFNLGTPIVETSKTVSSIDNATFNNSENGVYRCKVSPDKIEWIADDVVVNTYNKPDVAPNFNNVKLYITNQNKTITGYTYIWSDWVSGLQTDNDVCAILSSNSIQTDEPIAITLTTSGIDLSCWYPGLHNAHQEYDPHTGTGQIYYDVNNLARYKTKEEMRELFEETIISLNHQAGGFEGTNFATPMYELAISSSAGQIGEFVNSDGIVYPLVFAGDNISANNNEWGINLDKYYAYILKPSDTDPVTYSVYNRTQIFYISHNFGILEDSIPIYLCYVPQDETFNVETSTLCWTTVTYSQQEFARWEDFTLFGNINTTEIIDPDNIEYDYASDNWLDSVNDGAGSGNDDVNNEKETEPEDEEESILSTGFLYAFVLDNQSQDMKNLRDCLNADTLKQALRADYGNNLYDFIVSMHKVPCYPQNPVPKTITYGDVPFVYGQSTPLTLDNISNDKVDVHCGSVLCRMPQLYVERADFLLYGSASIYLPFIGVKELPTGLVYNKYISVDYRIDVVNGTCTANLSTTDLGIFASYSGQCRKSVPYTQTIDRSAQNLIAGVVQTVSAVGQAGLSIAGGNIAGATGVIEAGVDAAHFFGRALLHKADIAKGGSVSGSNGWDAPRKPILFLSCNDSALNRGTSDISSYQANIGYPSASSATVSELSGYNEYDNINLKGIPARDDELLEIKNILQGGFYI